MDFCVSSWWNSGFRVLGVSLRDIFRNLKIGKSLKIVSFAYLWNLSGAGPGLLIIGMTVIEARCWLKS